jgi:benzoate-CoA ligase
MDTRSARRMAELPEIFNAAEDLLAPNLSRHPHKTAIIDHRGSCSYQELADRVSRMAGVFEALGVKRDNRVLLCLTDTRDFPTVFLGAIRAGVIPVPLNTLLTADDYAWIIHNSGAHAVFVSAELADKWQDVAASEPHVHFVTSEAGSAPALGADLESLLSAANSVQAVAATHRDDVAFWLYTSGSTGRPKGAMHIHGSMRLSANLYGLGTAGVREDDVVLSVAKQFFAYGLGNGLIFPFAAGATAIHFNGRATPDAISDLIERHQVSVLGGVPTFFAGWLAHPSCPTRESAPALRQATSAGEALPAHLGAAFQERFGADVLDGLGSTEMLHIFVSQKPGQVRFGCTGRAVDGYRVRVVGDDGQDVAPGEIGTLHVSGPTTAIGYWRNREKTIGTFCGEWTITGDKYVIDAEGWLTYSGRADDMLKVGGIYVSPIEVEEALASHPDVMEAAVVGAEDADGLVKPFAYVVLHDEVEASATLNNALKAHVKDRLAPYKYPRWIEIVDELPKTATGKIQRFRLRDASD